MKKPWASLVVTAIVIACIGVLSASMAPSTSGIYENKGEMCQDVAQRYMRTTRYTVIPERDQEQWAMAVDVETDLYKLCMLDLRRQSLGAFESVVSAKYGNLHSAPRPSYWPEGKMTANTQVEPTPTSLP